MLLPRASTIGAIVMTPLLTKLLAGQLVPVDAAVRHTAFCGFIVSLKRYIRGPCISHGAMLARVWH